MTEKSAASVMNTRNNSHHNYHSGYCDHCCHHHTDLSAGDDSTIVNSNVMNYSVT